MQIDKTVASNGLETLFINSPGATSASVQFWFRAGSALEKKEEQGIAHFLEHMFFKGTEKRPGARIAHEVESFGGEINAFTSFDYTCYYINTPVNSLSKTVDILMDMVANPEFLEKELIPEREVVFEEFRRALDNPSQFNFKRIQESSFTKGYAHQILGTEKTIKNFTRDQLVSFRNRYYNLDNALLIIAGDIKSQPKLSDQISKYTIPKGGKSSFPEFKVSTKEQLDIHEKQVNQCTLTFAIQAPKYLEGNASSEDLALNCLAYGEISPLYKELVTNLNIVSGVSGSSMFFNKGGIHFFKLACPPENLVRAIAELEKSLKKVLKEGFSDHDVQRIKKQYIASKIYEKESIEAYSFSLGHGFAQNGNIYSEEDFISQIKDATLSQINKSLVDIFKKEIHVTIQKPEKIEIKGLEERIKKFRSNMKSFTSKIKNEKTLSDTKGSAFDPSMKEVTLKKGIKLLYRQNTMTPTFVLHAYLKGGLAYETEKSNSLFYFLSRLMTYGYGKLNFEKLKGDLEIKSAYLNGFSGKNAYGLTLHGLSDNFMELNDHFFGTLLKPTIPTTYLNVEKELIKRTLHNHKQDPVKQCFQALNQMVFKNHPYSKSIIGDEKTLKNVKKKSLLELHEGRLQSSEIVFTYCGDQPLEKVKEVILNKIDSLKPRKAEPKVRNKATPENGQKLHIEFDREQTHVFIGKPAYSIHQKDDLYLKMITAYLSGQSSELFVEVRDKKGLCYSCQPIHHTALDAGYWGVYIGAGKDKVDAAIDAITTILDRLQSKGLKKSEFERIKKMLDGQNQLAVQTNEDYANFYSIPTLHGLGMDFQHNTYNDIRKSTHADFNKFLSKFFKTKWNIITVGPTVDKEN
jgi:zinc protease